MSLVKVLRLKELVFSLIPFLFLFAVFEGVLRAAGFYYSDTPLFMTGVESDPEGAVNAVLRYNNEKAGIAMKKDARQLWVPVNSFEDELTKKKPAGVVRLAALGDSCTMGCTGTSKTYPGIMQEILNTGRARYEVLNAGVGSHSSYQGLQRLRHTVMPYRPDILTVYFGWNDHWITNVPDKEVRLKNPQVTAVLNFLERFRTYQAYHYLISRIRGSSKNAEVPAGGESGNLNWAKLRVSAEDYAANLNAMIDLAQKEGIKILLVTAPYDAAGFQPFSNFPFPREALVEVHENYLNVVRLTAALRSVPILDLAQEIAQGTPEPVFSQDGIHFNPWGCRYIAERFVSKLSELGWTV